jgi:hypothetical protein
MAEQPVESCTYMGLVKIRIMSVFDDFVHRYSSSEDADNSIVGSSVE